jgi:hypothetical protein
LSNFRFHDVSLIDKSSECFGPSHASDRGGRQWRIEKTGDNGLTVLDGNAAVGPDVSSGGSPCAWATRQPTQLVAMHVAGAQVSVQHAPPPQAMTAVLWNRATRQRTAATMKDFGLTSQGYSKCTVMVLGACFDSVHPRVGLGAYPAFSGRVQQVHSLSFFSPALAKEQHP